MKFDGETTGGQAAIEVLAAERKRREELAPTVTQKLDASMSAERVATVVSIRRAEAAGRIRVLDKRKEN